MSICPVTTTSDSQAVSATAAKMATEMVNGGVYLFVCSVASWVKQSDFVETFAELDLGGEGSGALDTVVQAAERGPGGNDITVEVLGDSGAAAGVTIGEVGDAVTIHFEDGVSTVEDVEDAITASATLITVKTAGTAATVLATATDQITPGVSLAGGDGVAEPIASAADGSMFVPAGSQILLDGTVGDSLSVIRASGDGTASLTRCKVL